MLRPTTAITASTTTVHGDSATRRQGPVDEGGSSKTLGGRASAAGTGSLIETSETAGK